MDRERELINRISDCQKVVNELVNSPAWLIIIQDLQRTKQSLDDNWQNMADNSPDLREARIMKLAAAHILGLRDRYETDLRTAERELYIMRNPDKAVGKDYDLETNMEV